jgi:hypothetical protein
MDDTPDAKKSRDAAYDRLTNLLGRSRKEGALRWDAVLDLTRELVELQTYGSAPEARAAMRRDYDEDRWIGHVLDSFGVHYRFVRIALTPEQVMALPTVLLVSASPSSRATVAPSVISPSTKSAVGKPTSYLRV